MYYDVPEGLGLRKIAADIEGDFMQVYNDPRILGPHSRGWREHPRLTAGLVGDIRDINNSPYIRNEDRPLVAKMRAKQLGRWYKVNARGDADYVGPQQGKHYFLNRPMEAIGGVVRGQVNKSETQQQVSEPKPAPSTWTQKIKDSQNGLAGPANASIEFRRHMYQQGQRFVNSPFAQRFIDRMRSGSK